MPEYSRVVTFEADASALDALVAEISSAEGAPPGVPDTRITVLADRCRRRSSSPSASAPKRTCARVRRPSRR